MSEPIKIYRGQGQYDEIDPVTGLPLKIRKANDLTQDEAGIYNPDIENVEPSLPFDPAYRKKQSFQYTASDTPEDIMDYEGHAQSTFTQGLYALGRLVPAALGKGLQGIGQLGGLLGIDNHGTFGTDWIASTSDNALAQLGTAIEEGIDELMPIYKTKEYMNSSPFSKLIRPEFWTDDVPDMAEFMAGMLLPGGVIGKGAGIGAKIATRFGLKAAAGEQVAANLAARAKLIDKVVFDALSASTMSLYNAASVRKEILNATQRMVMEGKLDPNVDWKQVANDEAAKSFAHNLALFSASNLITANAIFKAKGANIKKKLPIMEDPVTGQWTKDLTGWNKYLTSIPGKYALQAVKSGFHMGPLTMGIMSDIDSFSIKEGERILAGELPQDHGKMSVDDTFAIISKIFDYSDQEKQAAVVSGALLGMLPIPGIYNPYKHISKEAKLRENILERMNDSKSRFLDISKIFRKDPKGRITLSTKDGKFYQRNDIPLADGNAYMNGKEMEISQDVYNSVAKEHEIPLTGGSKDVSEFALDKNGKRIVDPKKYADMIGKFQTMNELSDLLDLASDKGEESKVEYYRKKILGEYAIMWNDIGMMDQFLKKFDDYKNLSPEELNALGIDPKNVPADISNRLEDYKAFTQRVINHYNAVENNIIPRSRKEAKRPQEKLVDKDGNEILVESDISEWEIRRRLLNKSAIELFAIQDALKLEKKRLSELDDLLGSETASRREGLAFDALHRVLLDKLRREELKNNTEEGFKKIEQLEKEIADIVKKKQEYNEKNPNDRVPLDPKSIDDTMPGLNPMRMEQELRIKELEELEKSVGKTWTNLFNNNSWYGKYKSLRDEIRLRFTPYDFRYKIDINDVTTPASYNAFEKRRLVKERILKNINNAKKEFFNSAIGDLLDKNPLPYVVDFILKNSKFRYRLDPENYKKISDRIAEEENFIDGLRNEERDLNISLSLGETINEKRLEDISKKIMDFDQVKQTYDDFINRRDQIVDDSIGKISKIDEGELKRDIAEGYLADTKDIIDNFLNIKDYSNVSAVEDQIRTLTNLERIIKERENDPAFDKERTSLLNDYLKELNIDPKNLDGTFLNDVQNQIDALKKILENVKKASESKTVKDSVIDKQRVHEQYDNLGINLSGSTEDSISFDTDKSLIHAWIRQEFPDAWNLFESSLKKYIKNVDANLPELRALYNDFTSLISKREGKQDLFNSIDVVFKNRKLSSENIVKSHSRFGDNKRNSTVLEAYFNNPKAFFKDMIAMFKDPKLDSDANTSINIFLREGDLYDFIENIKKESTKRGQKESNDLLKIIENHQDIIRLEELVRDLSTEYDYQSNTLFQKSDLAQEKKDNKENLPTPNKQQYGSIIQLLKHLSRKVDRNDPFKNVAVLMGEAGTGKSTMFRWLVRWATDIQDHEVLAVGPGHAADIIGKKLRLKGLQPSEVIKMFADGSINKYKLIIFDEFVSLTEKDANEFMDAYKKHIEDGGNTKIILSGDPNQSSGSMLSMLDRVGILNGSSSFYYANPLSIVYRTMVNAITDRAEVFKSTYEDITKRGILGLTNNADPWNNNGELWGIGGSVGQPFSRDQFIDNVKKIIENRTGDNKTRAIIVTPNDLTFYEKAFEKYTSNPNSNVLILTTENIHGREFDEVYINIDPSKYADTRDFNRSMYTAITRGINYVLVGNIKMNELNLDDRLKEKAESQKNDIKDNTDEFIKDRDRELDIYNELNGEAKPEDVGNETVNKGKNPDPIDTEINNENKYDQDGISGDGDKTEEIPIDHFEQDDEAKDVEEKDKGLGQEIIDRIHRIIHTTFRAFKPENNSENSRYGTIKEGDNVHYVVDTYFDQATKTNKKRIRIVSEVSIKGEEGKHYYREIGVVGLQDLPQFGKELRTIMEDVINGKDNIDPVVFEYNHDLGSTIIYKPDSSVLDGAYVLASGKVSKNFTNKLTFKRAAGYVRANVGNMMDKVLKAVRPDGEPWRDLENEQWLRDNTRFKIFTKREADKITTDGESEFRVKPGVPYLYVTGIIDKGKTRQEKTQPIFIEVNPRRFNYKQDKFISPLVKFDDTGNIPDADFIRDGNGKIVALKNDSFFNIMFRLNRYFNLIDSSGHEFGWGRSLFNKLIHKIADADPDIPFEKLRKEVLLNYFAKDLVDEKPEFKLALEEVLRMNYDEIKYLATRGDELANVKVAKKDKEGKVISYQRRPYGSAHSVWNAIAKSNLMPSGVVIRGKLGVYDAKGNKIYVNLGRGLLSTTKSHKYSDVTKDIHDKIRRRSEKIGRENAKNVGKEWTQEDSANIDKITLGEAFMHQNRSLSEKQIKKIFSFDSKGDTIDSQDGGALRIPLDREWFNSNERSAEEQGSYLEENFDGILPTSIGVEIKNKGISRTSDKRSSTEQSRTPDKGKESPESLKIDDIDFNQHADEGDIRYTPPDRTLAEKEYTGDLGRDVSMEGQMEFLKKIMPDINDSQLQDLSELYHLGVRYGKPLLGALFNGAIYLKRNEQGLTKEKILRHEGFHRIWNYYLKPRERQQVYEFVRKNVDGSYTMKQAEEYLAMKYMDFVQKKETQTGIIYRIVNKIKNFIDFVTGRRNEIDRLFTRIENGRYKTNLDPSLNTFRTMVDIVRDFETSDNYRYAKNFFTSMFTDFLNGVDSSGNKRKVILKEVQTEKGKILIPVGGMHNTVNEAINNIRGIAERDVKDITTKKDRGETLTSDEIRRLDAFSRLLVKNKDGEYKVMNDLMFDIFPDLKKFNRDDKTLQDELSEVSENDSDTDMILKNVIEGLSSGTINHESQAHLLIKSVLASLYTKDGSLKKMINPRYSFEMILKKLSGLDMKSNFPVNFKRRFRNGNFRNPEEKAIYEKISSLYDNSIRTTITRGNKTIDLPGNMAFFGTEMFVYSTDPNVKIKDLTNTDGIIRIRKNNTSRFFFDIRNVPQVNEFLKQFGSEQERYDVLKEWYDIAHSREVFVEVVAGLGSLYNSNPYYSTYEYRFKGRPGLVYNYTKNRGINIYNSVRNDIYSVLRDTFEPMILGGTSSFSPSLLGRIKSVDRKNVETMNKVINDFIHELGFNRKTTYSSDTPASTIDTIQKLLGKLHDTGKIETKQVYDPRVEEIVDVYTTPEKILSDSEGYIEHLADIIVDHSVSLKPSSYIDGKGNSRFFSINTSYGIDTIIKLVSPYAGYPKHLTQVMAKRTGNSFFRFNILSENPIYDIKQRIYEYVNHDTSKSKDGGQVKEYRDESKVDWLRRNMIVQFLAIGSDRGNTYIQNFWTMSDRRWTMGAKMNVLGMIDIRKSIRAVIEQEANRIDPDINKLFDVDNYRNNWKKGTFDDYGFKWENAESWNKKSEEEKNKAVDLVFETLRGNSDRLIDIMIDNYDKLRPDADIGMFYKSLNKKWVIPSKYVNEPMEIISGAAYKALTPEQRFEYDKKLRAFYKPMAEAFYMNYFLNGHFLNQTVLGDLAFYKDAYDINKRMAIAFSPGSKGFTHDNFINSKYKVLVVDDVKKTLSSKEFEKEWEIFKKEYDITDGQGFMTPEASEKRKLVYGKKAQVGATKKAVGFGIDENGIPRAIKYSVQDITDPIADDPRFVILKGWREKMKQHGVDELLFKSTMKVGAPNKLSKLNEKYELSIEPESIIELDLDHWKIQFNPEQSTDKNVKPFHQILQNFNNNFKNTETYQFINTHFSRITEQLLKDYIEESHAGRFTEKDRERFMPVLRKKLLDTFYGNPRTSEEYRILSAKDNDGNYIFPIDHPIFDKNAEIQITASFKNMTTESVRFKGAHLVLESSIGSYADIFQNGSQYELKYYNERGHTEIYVSDSMRGQLKEGDVLFGFRIPASGFHMGSTLEVKGFIPTKSGFGNVVIMPKEVVLFQDVDFDIDEVHVIRHDRAETDVYDPSGIKRFQKGEVLVGKKGKLLSEEIEKEISQTSDNGYKKELRKVWYGAMKNEVFNALTEAYSDSKNRDMVLSTMGFDRFENSETGIFKQISDITKKDTRPKRHQQDIVDQMNMFYDNMVASTLKGQFNIYHKAITFMMQNLPKEGLNLLKSDKETKGLELWDNEKKSMVRYDSFSINERVNNGKGEFTDYVQKRGDKNHVWKTYETGELYIVSAIDAVKKQILNVINVNKVTASAAVGMQSLGIPLDIVVRFMKQPSLIMLGELGDYKIGEIRNKLTDRYRIVNGKNIPFDTLREMADNVQLSVSDLESMMKVSMDNLSKEQVLMQIKVLKDYGKMSNIGKDIYSIGLILNINRNLPVTMGDIIGEIESIKKIYPSKSKSSFNRFEDVIDNPDLFDNPKYQELGINGNFSFPELQLFKNPYVRSSTKVLLYQKKTMELAIRKHSPLMVKWSEKINSIVSPQNYSGLKLDRNTPNSESVIRKEIEKYLMSNLTWNYEGKTLSTDRSNEEPYRVITSKDTFEYVHGVEAFNQRLIDELPAMKKKFSDNAFVSSLSSNRSSGRFRKLSFLNKRNATPDEMLDWKDSARELMASDEGIDFLSKLFIYAAINDGFRFTSTNFGNLLPEEMFVDFNRKLDNAWNELSGNRFKELSGNITEHFTTQLIFNNAENLKNPYLIKARRKIVEEIEDASDTEKPDVQEVVEKIDEPTNQQKFEPVLDQNNFKFGKDKIVDFDGKEHTVYYDMKYNRGTKSIKAFPEWITGFKDKRTGIVDLLVKLPIEGKYVYYQKFGIKALHEFYQTNYDIFTKGWYKDATVDPYHLTMAVDAHKMKVGEKGTFRIKDTTLNRPEGNEIVNLREKNDPLRTRMVRVEIWGVKDVSIKEKIKGKEISSPGKEYSYTVIENVDYSKKVSRDVNKKVEGKTMHDNIEGVKTITKKC